MNFPSVTANNYDEIGRIGCELFYLGSKIISLKKKYSQLWKIISWKKPEKSFFEMSWCLKKFKSSKISRISKTFAHSLANKFLDFTTLNESKLKKKLVKHLLQK